MLIVDAHLDLAYNAIRGRDVLRSVRDAVPDDEGTPSVSLEDLQAGGVGLVCGTIFCEPAGRNAGKGYRTAAEAAQMARRQLEWYQQQESAGVMRIVRSAMDLPGEVGRVGVPAHLGSQAPGEYAHPTPLMRDAAELAKSAGAGAGSTARMAVAHQSVRESAMPVIVLMEGADGIETPADVPAWFAAGVRIVGLAWKRTRYAGGTGDPGPLTPAGVELVHALDLAGMIHDVSHLAEESFWQLPTPHPRPGAPPPRGIKFPISKI